MNGNGNGKRDDFIGWKFEGGEVIANSEANRLQIRFDDIPDESTLADVKGWGFRWDRTVKAWQRILTTSAVFAASQIPAIQPLDGSNPVIIQPKYQRWKSKHR